MKGMSTLSLAVVFALSMAGFALAAERAVSTAVPAGALSAPVVDKEVSTTVVRDAKAAEKEASTAEAGAKTPTGVGTKAAQKPDEAPKK